MESWAPLSVKPRDGFVLPSPPDAQQEGALTADGGEMAERETGLHSEGPPLGLMFFGCCLEILDTF